MAGGLGIGGAAAAGISSGFQMGREADNDAAARAQRARDNARQDVLDAQRTSELQRQDKRQDTSDANVEQDRQIATTNYMMSDIATQQAALSQKYGGLDKVPETEIRPLISQANDLNMQRRTLLAARAGPQVQMNRQDALNLVARMQAGQVTTYKPGQLTQAVQALYGGSIDDFQRGPNGEPSKIGQGIKDVSAGTPAGNGGLVAQGMTALTGPDLQHYAGHIADDGAMTTGATITHILPAPLAPDQQPQPTPPLTGLSAALNAASNPPPAGAAPSAAPPPDNGMGGAPDTPAPGISEGTPPPASPMQALTAPGLTPAPPPAPVPAPPPMAPTTDPNHAIAVVNVDAVHPDGTQVNFHAPLTVSGGHNGQMASFSVSDAMQRMGQLGTLETYLNTPDAQAQLAQDKKVLGPAITDATTAYAAMHGDPKALLPAAGQDATTVKLNALHNYAVAHGITDAEAGAVLTGKTAPTTGIAAQLDQIHAAAVKDGLSDDAETAKLQKAGMLRTPPTGGQGERKPPAGYDYGSDGTLHFIKGGPADPDVKGGAAVLGAREAVFINRTLTSANEAAADLGNIVRMPTEASTGIFGGRKQGASILDAGKEALTNTMTSQEAQSYNVRAAGFHRSLAGIESAGLAPSGQLSNQMDSVVFKAGDSDMTKLEKLAQTRQIVEAGLETTLANPKLPKQQAQLAQTVISRIRAAVPFTMKDIDDLKQMQEADPNTTLNDMIKKNGLNKGGGAATGNFVEGRVYQDAKGNKATYSNGTWTPL